jgi:L-ascorbate metabolism protein UlaG (beta-lactamase superfamily)
MTMWFAVTLGGIAVVAVLSIAFLRLYPPFGGRPSAERLQRRRRSKFYDEKRRRFAYPLPTPMSMSAKDTLGVVREMIAGQPKDRPARPIEVAAYEPQQPAADGETRARVTWFGHSAVLIETDGKTLFIDPMLGRSPSPVPAIGGRRFSNRLPAQIEELPWLDAVILSHDHYDHLDYGTMKRMQRLVGHFYVPLGVAAHLERWGVEAGRITECDWWEETQLGGILLACTPARHFSGRSLGDRDATLWCSWVIRSREASIFFSGDSGYGPHFEEIGAKYGPFDLTCMECGQYDERWALIHMRPEETVAAHQDVRGGLLLPIHWGAFKLALHAWTDPIERVRRAALERGAALTTPRIGETVVVGAAEPPASAWWR